MRIQLQMQKALITLLFFALTGLIPEVLNAVQGQSTAQVQRVTLSELQKNFYKAELEMQINVMLEELTLNEALGQIAKEAGLKLTYRGDILVEKDITLQREAMSVSEALDFLLDGTGLDYKISQDGYLLVTQKDELYVVDEIYQETVSGQVIDSQTGEPLPGVNIVIQGTSTGTSTNIDGQFQLTVPSLNETLIISYIGFQTQEITIQGRSEIDIELLPQAIAGDELVVVGYGTQSTRQLSYSVEHINTTDLIDAPVATISQMLQGKLSGVTVQETTGRPGEGLRVRVRGAASITAGYDPLYVVDGMPINGNINDISASQIESITVLKDAAATSLYGSRAANGVVLIQTKQPVPGRTQVDINSYYGVQHLPHSRRLQMMNATEYAQYRIEVDELNGRTPLFQNPEQYGEGTDWFDLITKPAPIQNHNIAIGSGTETFSALGMLDYVNQDGIIRSTGYERLSLRINTRFEPNDKLRIGFNVAPIYSFNSNIPTDGNRGFIVGGSLLTSPVASPYNPDGSLALTATDPVRSQPNWLRVIQEQVYEDTEQRLLSRGFVEYEIIDGLLANISANIELDNTVFNRFDPSTIGRGLNAPPPQPARGWYDTSRSYNWLSENTLNYQTYIGDHSFDALIGFTAQSFRRDITQMAGNDYPDDKIQTISAAGQVSINSDIQKWGLLSYLARLNYSFKERYIFTASIRRDGSSRFGPERRWGNFPSFSVGWIVSDEEFWNIEPISFLKLNASFGSVGNYQIGNYSHVSNIGNVHYTFDNNVVAGKATTNVGNPFLGWEESISLNVGGDIHLFSDRLRLTYSYYTRKTSNLLYNVQVPLSSGFSNMETNIGELKFWGHDLSIESLNIENNNLSWNTKLSLSIDRNEVLALGTDNEALVESFGFARHITQPGQPIGLFYGMIFDGFYDTQEELDNSARHSTSQVGTVKFRDVNGDGIISQDDRAIIGSPWPDFTFGMTNNINYKDFDLSITISGSYGNLVGALHEFTTANLDASYNNLRAVDNRWKSPEDRGDGKYGISLAGSTWLERDWWNSRFLYDGSHLNFRNITFGYTIPLNPNSFIGRLRIYGSAQNVYLLTSYPGSSPEVSVSDKLTQQGIDGSAYPVPRTISFGVNLSF